MKKKSFILVSVISSILLGIGITAYVVLNDTFSFSNLSVDIGDSSGLGIGKIANDNQTPNGRKYQSSGTSQTQSIYDKLVKVDDEGNVDILRFYNFEGDIVEVPFHAIILENYGEFSYVAFSNWSLEFQRGFVFETWFPSFQALFYLENGKIHDPSPFKQFEYELIAIHNESGKVFDLKESVLKKFTYANQLQTSIVYLPDGFAYTTQPNENENNYCINRGLFKSSTNLLEFDVICSELLGGADRFGLALPNGDYSYNGGSKWINLYSFQTINTPKAYLPRISTAWGYGIDYADYLYISTNKFSWLSKLDFGSDFYQINHLSFDEQNDTYTLSTDNFPEIDISTIRKERNVFSSAPFTFSSEIEEFQNLYINISQYFPNTGFIESIASVEILDFNNNYGWGTTIISKLNLTYLIVGLTSTNNVSTTLFFIIDTLDKSLTPLNEILGGAEIFSVRVKNPNFFLFGFEYYDSSPIVTLKRTGNLSITALEGLVVTRYIYNIYNNQIYDLSETTPTFSYFEITPIN